MLGLILVLILALLLIGAATVALMARMLLRPARMTDGRAMFVLCRLSPADLGLAYEVVRFEVEESLNRKRLSIAGWWMAANASSKCVIVIHGYQDAKIGAIAWAPMFHALGYNVLAIDLRAHGESGGKFCTGGYFEREDVRAVINDIRAMRPNQTQQMILFGVSFGAAVALAAAEGRGDIDAVILDSPFADYRKAAVAQADLLGLPQIVLPQLAIRLAEIWSHADFAAVRPIELIPKIQCPLMAILNANEALNDADDAAAIDAVLDARIAAGKVTQVMRVDAEHALGLAQKTDEYIAQVAHFLEQ
jgi:alpha-beta hydrolase superfamily lysophospholipase